MMIGTLGLIETIGLVSAIEAADAALKAANVRLIGLTKVGSGIVTIQIGGDVGAVTAAVEAGGMAAEQMGKLRTTHVIPRLASSVNTILASKPQPKSQPVIKDSPTTESVIIDPKEENGSTTTDKKEQTPTIEDIEKMSNKQLRQQIQDLGIVEPQTQLGTMKKDELIQILTKFYSGGGR